MPEDKDRKQISFIGSEEYRRKVKLLSIEGGFADVQSLLEYAVDLVEQQTKTQRQAAATVINGVQIMVPREISQTIEAIKEMLLNPQDKRDEAAVKHIRNMADIYMESKQQEERKGNGSNGK